MRWVRIAARILLGIVFIAGALGKVADMGEFTLYVFSFGLLPYDAASLATYLLVALELILGICLTIGVFFRETRWVCCALLALFSAFLIWKMVSGDNSDCHCMGKIASMSPSASIIKNILLAILLALCWGIGDGEEGEGLLWLSVGFVTVLVCICVFSPPDFLRRGGHRSEDIDKVALTELVLKVDKETGRHLVCFMSTGCAHCKAFMRKLSGMVSRSPGCREEVFIVFMDAEPSDVDAFYSEYGAGIDFDYLSIPATQFIPIVNGSMPVAALVKDGEVVEEVDLLTLREGLF